MISKRGIKGRVYTGTRHRSSSIRDKMAAKDMLPQIDAEGFVRQCKSATCSLCLGPG